MLDKKATMLRTAAIFGLLALPVLACLAQRPVISQRPAADSAVAAVAFERIKGLEGEWAATLKGKQQEKVMVNTFHVIGEGSAVLAGEWLDGKQITSTHFYMVGTELRADHYCDLQNQPRFVLRPSGDDKTLVFEMRDATNLDTHPRHYHATTWHILDANHLTQDWQIAESGKEPKMIHMEFSRRK